MGFFSKFTKGIERGVKKAAKSTVDIVNPFSDNFDLGKSALAVATLGGSVAVEQAAEIGGSALAGGVAGLSKDELGPEAALEVSGDVDDAAAKKRRLLEAQRRNAPGLRQQSVLNPLT